MQHELYAGTLCNQLDMVPHVADVSILLPLSWKDIFILYPSVSVIANNQQRPCPVLFSEPSILAQQLPSQLQFSLLPLCVPDSDCFLPTTYTTVSSQSFEPRQR